MLKIALLTVAMTTLAQAPVALAQDRQQTPRPPFPYTVEELVHEHPAGHSLGVSITLPDPFGPWGAGPVPAVVMVSGSGAQDRDSTIFGHKPFAILADSLARKGVATIRFDDRGVRESTGIFIEATTYDFAADAAELIRVAAQHDSIDADRLGIMGHSEGGYVAMMVASGEERVPEPGADAEAVSFVVLLASPGVEARMMMAEQAVAQLRFKALNDQKLEDVRTAHLAYTKAFVEDAPLEEVEEATRVLVIAQYGASGVQAPPAAVQQFVDRQSFMVKNDWFRQFLAIDPAPMLQRIDQPTLVVNGGKDLQVLIDQNVPAIEAGLSAGGNNEITVLRYPSMNHIFQPARRGSIPEYNTIGQSFDETALEEITDWVAITSGALTEDQLEAMKAPTGFGP
ncbi:MAG: alpha/beta fold hydrolase [Planctomycetota bacterium]